MKNLTTVIIICAAFTSSVLSSCSKLFENPDINTNPNAVTNVDLPTLMGGTLLGVGLLHEDTDVRIASMWAGELNGLARAHLGYSQYIVSAQNFTWSPLYPVAGQARLMQLKADSIGNAWGKGIGQVLEAMVLAKATALYGDVPYSQAFDAARYPTPAFDKQLDVYSALQVTLDNAITNLSAATGSAYPAKDFIYKGDVKKWLAAANTLKARLYLHTGNYAQAVRYAQQGISSSAGDALMPHGTAIGVDINQNYDFFAVSRIGDTGFDGAYLPKLMQSRIGSANTKTDETALYNYFFKKGITATNSLDGNTVDGAFVAAAPQPLVTYYENQLILAEAQARLGQNNEALNALNNVRASLNNGIINGRTFDATGRRYDAYTLADFGVAGLANSTGAANVQVALLYEIISQRYICFLMQYEAFNDYRRLASAVPVVQLPIPLYIGTQKPQRFIYPQVEINTNPNVPKPLASQFTKLPVFP
ncbi:SusD/RagB family nutrient-binding outer membrane lipoprotein [Mucilaginibacter aquatilis]|uniref:SusD/RagB family nutrient-binding outer membrane lipoprotein n=1 Tax=Mucilaginibacter aquatilis TaxID=1517760 RepID=A0A6I4IRK2_9SPHI|nr:SusD/RagB family nutrient-binding outer membrane lipoprotein [Mucilaginibacter aquatilis]MVN93014.1 SusD/RagB family nutrient-binding outer membrane lipoprotein [Mucilaginibacter aquatilis]